MSTLKKNWLIYKYNLFSILLQAAVWTLCHDLCHPVHRVLRVLSDTWWEMCYFTVLSGISHVTAGWDKTQSRWWIYCQSFWIVSSCGQVYKFLYACRLLDCGLSSQAFHYCEVVGRALLRQLEPDLVLTGEVVKVGVSTWALVYRRVLLKMVAVCSVFQLSDRLRCSEAQYGETGFSGSLLEPEWLRRLRAQHQSLQVIRVLISSSFLFQTK